MDSNLLKEAIADAKAVRQTALANAKAALEEAFGSRLEAMFAPKLDEETTDPMQPSPEVPEAMPPMGQTDVVNETDIEEIIRELESQLPQDNVPAPDAPIPGTPPVGAPPVGAPPMDAAPVAPPVGAPPVEVPPADPNAPAPVPPVEGEEDLDEEIDINSLLESLKAEEDEEEETDECIKEGVPVNSSGIGTSDNKLASADARDSSHIESAAKDKVGGGEGYKGGPADPTTAKRPNQGKNVTKTNLSTPGGALTEEKETGVPGGTVTAKEPTEAKRPNEGPIDAEHMDTPALHKENLQLKSQLQEAEQTLTYLRGQLNEINLLNAKLLYTNKLFKEYSMDNNKKMKIVEMFDLAKNVREVKMTYAVIAESLNFGADFKKRVSSKVQNITEGMASRPVAGTAPKQIIAESAKSEMVSKFQRLAGIKVS